MNWTERYREGGLDGAEHLQLLEEVKSFSRAWLRREAKEFAGEYLRRLEQGVGRSLLDATEVEQVGRSLPEQIGRFWGRMRTFVRSAVLAGSMALIGPRKLNDVERQQVDRLATIQDARLDLFRVDMARMRRRRDGAIVDVVTPGRFVARAESYGAFVWGGAQEVARASLTRAGVFDQERRILGDAKHCPICLDAAAMGWQPIGTLPAIGDSYCLANCHCRFEFRAGDHGEPHLAGRGPLSAKAFGRTG